MNNKRNKRVSISGNTEFMRNNIIMILVLVVSVLLSIFDKFYGIIDWPKDYGDVIGVATQIITAIVSLVASVMGISISLQNEEYFGIKITKLYALRVSKHYSIIEIIIISISLCILNLAFYMINLIPATIGSLIAAIIFLIKIVMDEIPLMSKDEKAIKKILKDNLIDCYLYKKEANKDLKESIKYLLYRENFKELYEVFGDEIDEDYNQFLLMKLLEYQQDLGFELADKYNENEQKIICSSLQGNVWDLMFRHISLTDEQYEEIYINRYLLTRVLFRIQEIPCCRNLVTDRISGLLQSLAFQTDSSKVTNDMISSIIISLVAGTVQKYDFSIIKEIRYHFSISEWELRKTSPGLNVFAVISLYLYYLCSSEPDVPDDLKKEILQFIGEGNFIEKNAKIISWKKLFAKGADNFNVDYKDFVDLAMKNEHNLEYWLMGIGAKAVVFDRNYLTRWYLTNLLNCNRVDTQNFSFLLDTKKDNRYFLKSFGESCFDENQKFVPTEEMKKIISFYFDDSEQFKQFIIRERDSHPFFDFINEIKLDELKDETEAARLIDDIEFANKIKSSIESTVLKEWGFDSSLYISNSSRYFSVYLEKFPQAFNFEDSIVEYCIRSVLSDLENHVKKTVVYNSKSFEENIELILSKKIKYITPTAKNTIPHFHIKNASIQQHYIDICNPLTEFESKILGMTTLIVEEGFAFNCVVDKVEIRELSEDELSERVKNYQREDGQYVFNGVFVPQEEITSIIKDKFRVLTVIMRHEIDSSKDTVFELKPYSTEKDV